MHPKFPSNFPLNLRQPIFPIMACMPCRRSEGVVPTIFTMLEERLKKLIEPTTDIIYCSLVSSYGQEIVSTSSSSQTRIPVATLSGMKMAADMFCRIIHRGNSHSSAFHVNGKFFRYSCFEVTEEFVLVTYGRVRHQLNACDFYDEEVADKLQRISEELRLMLNNSSLSPDSKISP